MRKIDDLIGKTPLVRIRYEYQGEVGSVYAKLEYYNYTGSIKDRMAYYVLKRAYESGELKKGMPIIEATSGNTGISLVAIGALLGHPVYIFMPAWASEERRKIMEMYGAVVTLVTKEEGGFKRAIALAEEKVLEVKGFSTRQFDNYSNIMAHYETTGKEIIDKLARVDLFVSGIGTGGTLMGIGKKVKERDGALVYALEPDKMPMLSLGKNLGNHKIEGIGDDFIPSIVDSSIIDGTILIADDEAIAMSRKLARELGLGVGISSGANFLAAVLLNKGVTVTVFPDDNKKYLSTELAWNCDSGDSVVARIKLLDIEVV